MSKKQKQMIKLSTKAFIPKGYTWTVERHEPMKSFDPKSLQLHFEPEQEKGYIKGEVLAERMKGKGLNSNVLEYLLKHTELIPEDWKNRYVFFWGTVYRHADGDLCVRYLFWDGGRWGWDYDWLVSDWRSSDPAAVSSEVSSIDIKNKESKIDVCKEKTIKTDSTESIVVSKAGVRLKVTTVTTIMEVEE